MDSFLETFKNCDFTFARHLNTRSLLDNHFINKYKLSFVSSSSFFENKHGFQQSDLENSIPTLILKNKNLYVPLGFYQKVVSGLLKDNHCTFNIQLRGFKTDRSVKSELERNPPIFSRIKNVFGISNSGIETKIPGLNTANTEKLKQVLTSSDALSENEKQRIKIAFAEGYLLGHNAVTKPGKSARYIKAVSQILTIFIFFAIVVSLMASASGSVFR